MKGLLEWFYDAPFSMTRKARVHDTGKKNKVICEDFGSLNGDEDTLDNAKVVRVIPRKEEGTVSVYVRL